MKATMVPAKPFVEILRSRYEVLGGSLRELADEMDLDPKRVQAMLSLNQKAMAFSVADRIVTKLGHPFLWHEDKTLNKIYREVNLDIIDLLDPIDSPGPQKEYRERIVGAWEALNRRTLAADSLGMDRASYSKRLDACLAEQKKPRRRKKAPVAAR